MPYLYYDGEKRRWYMSRKVPKDLHAILGRKFFMHKFPQSVSEAEANDQSLLIGHRWEGEIARARGLLPKPSILDAVIDIADRLHRGEIPKGMRRLEPGETLSVDEIDPAHVPPESIAFLRQQYEKLGARLRQFEPRPIKLAGCPTETVIDLWKADRDTQPGEPAIRNKRSKALRMFKALNLPDDWTGLSADHLQTYKQALLAEGGNTLARDHLIDLCALARVAKKNRKITADIAAEIKVPPKRQKSERVPLTDAEAKLILDNLPADPIVAWCHRLISQWGYQTAELIDADVRDVEVVDGILCMHIRPDYRVGDLKTVFRKRVLPVPSRYVDDFAAYVESIRKERGMTGPLFPQIAPDRDGSRANRASKLILEHMRRLGIESEPGKLRDFYSWRGRVTTQLEALIRDPKLTATPDRVRYIVGHAPRDVHAANYLGHPVGELLPIIDAIPEPKSAPLREAA